MAKSKLTPKQSIFIDEYLIDLNATQAAIRAGYSSKTAQQVGSQNLLKPVIQTEIKERLAKRAEKLEITAEMVLSRWWAIANQDVNELIQYRRLSCSGCYPGADDDGIKDPNPDCPQCGGEGQGNIHIADTRKLKGGALALYRGIQLGKEGIKVLMADQDKALENVARHLGMFKDSVDLTSGGKPLPAPASPVTQEQLDAAIKRARDAV